VGIWSHFTPFRYIHSVTPYLRSFHCISFNTILLRWWQLLPTIPLLAANKYTRITHTIHKIVEFLTLLRWLTPFRQIRNYTHKQHHHIHISPFRKHHTPPTTHKQHNTPIYTYMLRKQPYTNNTHTHYIYYVVTA
jgi:hypothetical protein